MNTPYARMVYRAGVEFQQSLADRRAGIVKILAALPLLEDQRSNIEGTADLLVLESRLMSGNDSPRAIQKGTEQSILELLRLKKKTTELVRHLDSMNRTAIDAFEKHHSRRHRLEIAKDMVSLSMAAGCGIKDLRSSAPIQKIDGKEKLQAAAVIRRTASIYKTLTGLPTTVSTVNGKAGGPFHAFVKAIFNACGIKASAESQIKAWKKTL